MELPENVMASTQALPAATPSTSVPSTQPGTSTTSKAQQKLASTWTGPVSLVPRPVWIAQLDTDLSIPLKASAGESTLVFNINAVPKSPARPIPSTSSSKARSPPRFLQSSVRAVTQVADEVVSSSVECVAGRGTSRTSNAQSLAGEIVWCIAALRTRAGAVTSFHLIKLHIDIIHFLFSATPLG